MTEVKHTPGPWRVFGKMTGKVVAPDGAGYVEICEAGDFRDEDLTPWNHQRWNADARLIAELARAKVVFQQRAIVAVIDDTPNAKKPAPDGTGCKPADDGV